MRRLLILTVLDIVNQPNNREHHLIRHLPAGFDETVVVFKRRNRSGRPVRMLKEMLVPSTRSFATDGVQFLEVNTLLNHYPGMSRDLTGAQPGPPAPTEGPASNAAGSVGRRRLLLSGASALGVVKDWALVSSLLLACLLRIRGRFDVCVALGPWSGLVAWCLRKAGRVTCLVYEDRDYEPAFIVSRLRRGGLVRLERFLMRRADLVISIGDELARLRRRETGCDVAVVSTGVDTEKFREARLKIPHPPTLVYSGNLTWWSGLELAVAAMPDVLLRLPEARLLIIGGGIASYEARLRSLAEHLGVGARVILTGPRPNDALPGLFREADVGLASFPPLPLRRFAVPLKVFEYMAAGLPAVVTRGTQSAEVVERLRCGVAVPFDRRALAAAVCDLLGNPPLRAELGDNAIRASAAFDWRVLLAEERRLIEAARERCSGGRAA